jgi:hypothetical protein
VWSGFSYFDEIIAIVCLLYCVTQVVKGYKIEKNDRQIIFLLLLIGCVGILGNILYDIQNSMEAIVLDILATYKNLIIYFAFKWRYKNSAKNIDTLHFVAKIFRIYVIVCVFFALINQFIDINMSSGFDFGLKNFKFIFYGSGDYAMTFYVIAFSVCLDCVMNDFCGRGDKISIVFMMFAWLASLTTRSISYVVLYLVIILLTKYFTKGKIETRHLVIIGLIAFAIGYTTIEYYFMNNTVTARGVLLKYSIYVLKKYFPLGVGFASYGSNMAAEHYSSLYAQFGFNSVWGLYEENPSFANDSFWPEIFGQFGFIGTILVCILLVMWYKKILGMNIAKRERLTCQWFFLVMLIGSSGTKTYIHFTTIGVYILLALYENTCIFDDSTNKLKLQEKFDENRDNHI